MRRFIGYLRVSTQRQGESGLGLEAQRNAVQAYVSAVGGTVFAWFTEVESGKRSDRPQLAAALLQARATRSTLVIAKLDRLARNVAFVSALMDAGVDFVACDNPSANRLVVHILAAVAENEARAISERTTAALAAYRARGGKLGAEIVACRNLTPEAARKGAVAGAAAQKKAAGEFLAVVLPALKQMKDAGLSQAEMAAKMNERGYTTRSGRPWKQANVSLAIAKM